MVIKYTCNKDKFGLKLLVFFLYDFLVISRKNLIKLKLNTNKLSLNY